MNTAAPFAECAPAYRARGFNAIPLVDKRPVVPWKSWQVDKMPWATVVELVERYPNHSVGVILGRILDLEWDSTEARRRIEPLIPPGAPRFLSPRGMHNILRPGASAMVRTCKLPGVRGGELRGFPSYSAFPLTPGREWIVPLPERLEDIPVIPEELERLFDPLPHQPDPIERLLPPLTRSIQELAAAWPSASQKQKGELLLSFQCGRDYIARACGHFGIPVDGVFDGRLFRCPLHPRERHPSCTLQQNRDGVWVVHHWHNSKFGGPEYLTFPMLLAAMAYGEVRELRDPEHAVWSLRLLTEFGVLDPIHVDFPPLPQGAIAQRLLSPAVAEVYAGVRRLFGVRWLFSPGDPSPLAKGFTAAFCGVSPKQTWAAVQTLWSLEVIQKVGELKRGCRKTSLFMPVAL